MSSNLPLAFELTDSAIVLGGDRLSYDAIEAISFKLVPLIQNRLSRAFYGIDRSMPLLVLSEPSMLTAKLALHLPGGETVWLARGLDFVIAKSRVEALHAAAEFLSQRTFERRNAGYRTQLASEGHFDYRTYRFCRDGSILRRGRRLYNVNDKAFSVVLGDFHVHFERKQTSTERLLSWLGQSGHTLDISRDRDCFLSMYRLAYGVFWADEAYRDEPAFAGGGSG
jgi:hypothetical protein